MVSIIGFNSKGARQLSMRGPGLALEVMVAIVPANREYQGKKWGAAPEPKMNSDPDFPFFMLAVVNKTLPPSREYCRRRGGCDKLVS
jgi:hypothetical protein